MGYKLAGFDVIGCNEIDPRMMEVYRKNHNPKYSYLEPIQTLKQRKDLPKELYQLDILDGSPPCSSFSFAGNRDKDWGKEKYFREGQAKQVLDTLFFDFIDLAKKLQPKVVVAENVKGLLQGAAKKYTANIMDSFRDAGFIPSYTLVNAASMGVPQRRERVFFVAVREDLASPFVDTLNLFKDTISIDMGFSEPPIPYKEIKDGKGKEITGTFLDIWQKRKPGDRGFEYTLAREFNRYALYSYRYIYDDEPIPTLTTKCPNSHVLFTDPKCISDTEVIKASSFPLDYDFGKEKSGYICGMSVPPVMMANIATRVYEKVLSKIKSDEDKD